MLHSFDRSGRRAGVDRGTGATPAHERGRENGRAGIDENEGPKGIRPLIQSRQDQTPRAKPQLQTGPTRPGIDPRLPLRRPEGPSLEAFSSIHEIMDRPEVLPTDHHQGSTVTAKSPRALLDGTSVRGHFTDPEGDDSQ
jgi:hypothetical protein